ncbi:MAG: hypothetical protein IKW47_02860, partial [Alistipes sp.]|nr:hypothetical protein [Alistipes sp.]
MKHIFTLLFAVLAFAACTQNDVDELLVVRQDLPQTLTAGFEADDTRIQLNEAGKTVWTKDDLVSVFYLSNANQKWQYQGETGERVGVLKCVESVLSTKETDYVVVAYPYNDNYYLNASSCNLRASLPATQHYAKDSYGLDGNIMVSRSEYNQVSLRNVCGWLKVQLVGDNQVVKSIKLYGNNGEQVAGELYINTNDATAILASNMGIMPDSDEEGAGGVGGGLQFNNTIYTDVTLVCDEEVVLGNKATAFYIALPPQTFENGVTVEVKCKGYEPMVISTDKELTIQRNHIRPMETVKFEAASEAVSDATFTFENIDVTTDYFSYALDVIPSDKKLPFIVMSVSSDYIESYELQSDEALFADDCAFFEYIGSYYGMSALEVMMSRAKMGDVRGIRVNYATPGDDYIFYAYYIDPASGALASKIARCEITAGHPELGQASFNFTYEINGPDVFTQVDPVGFEGDYYFDVMTAEELAAAEKAGYTKEEYFVKWWAYIVSGLKFEGNSVDKILAENTCWGEDRNTWSYELMANSDYYLFAFTLEQNSLCSSVPQYEKFTTGDAVMSNNELSVYATNVTSRAATFTILTTIPEDRYSFSWATAAEWASYGSSDVERV